MRHGLLLILALLSVAAPDSSSQTLIDNFDASKKLPHWLFSNGAEFPGASGKLSLGPGHEKRGAILAYRFTCQDQIHCGSYVAAIWKAPRPLEATPGAALSLWVRFPSDVRLTIRVTDQTGQTLQFHANAPTLEQAASDDWRQIVMPVTDKTTEHWGGVNNGQLQGSLTSVAILADSGYAHATQGQMAFDDVRLFTPTDSILHLDQTTPLMTAPQGTAELRPRLGVNIHFLHDDRALDLAKDAGFSFVRADLLWAKLEKQGRYDFTPFDGLMDSLEARGMGVLWMLAYGHSAHGGPSPQSMEDIAAYARYAAAAVSHFHGRNVRFEIWNEPNNKRFLPNPSVYPGLLRAALDAIRGQDPDAAISTGGTSGIDFPFLAPLLHSGAAQKASAIAIHPYRDAGPETLPADLSLLRNLVQHTAAPDIPVWDTEWGYSSYGRDSSVAQKRQAVLTARQALTVWALGLPVAVLYDLSDDGADPSNREQNFGLLHQDNRDKPAMKSIRALTTIAQGRTCVGLVRGVPYGVHALRLDGKDDIVFAVWNDAPGVHPRIQLAPGELLSVSNVFGEPVARQNEMVLEETMGPLYLRLKRRSLPPLR
ncbi:MAG TPA: cellulase family glycosylhydrolase [Bryobacteraceae bacterium]|jgi:hypothetical protein